jgi:uncharacterized membrane protein YccC
MAPEAKPAVKDPNLEAQLMLSGVARLSADTGSDGAPPTPGGVRLRALKSLGKGVGLVLLGGVIMAVLMRVHLEDLALFPMVPTLFVGAAYLVAGLTGLMTGRPWDRTPGWVKLPMMVVGALLAFVLILVVGIAGPEALREKPETTDGVR